MARPEQASYLYFMSFALSVLEHEVLKAEAFVSLKPQIVLVNSCMHQQDNSGALLQNEEYVITEDLKSGIKYL